MLGTALAMGLYGFAKARVVGHSVARETARAPLLSVVTGPLAEELQFRAGLEDFLLSQMAGLSPTASAAVTSGLFGLVHLGTVPGCAPGWMKGMRVVEAGLAGVVYSHAYRTSGLVGAFFTHLAHNLGVEIAARTL